MNHKKLNLIIGLVVFAIAQTVYFLTMQPTLPFWDCGEFAAVAHTMGVPHPPGSPLFTILGRVFSMLIPFEDVAKRLNFLSAFAASFGVMFSYFIIIRLIIILRKIDPSKWDISEKISAYASSVIGAFSLAFCYTYWFSAVESEVYAISIFLYVLSVWSILKWWEVADEQGNERWILLIAFIFGIILGFHIQALLSFFGIAILYRARKTSTIKPIEFALFILVTSALFIIIYPGIVLWSLKAIKQFGTISIFIFFALLLYSMYYTYKKHLRTAHIFLTSVFLLVLGYSSIFTIYFRAKANPPINENDPSTVERMLSYLNREQYGGTDIKITNRRYSQDARHQNSYKKYKSDFDFFWKYQLRHMYWRYFAWNFIGKAGDVQDDGYEFKDFWALPFIVGLIGAYYSFRQNPQVGLAILALFAMSGAILVVQLNMPEPQPRERDYAFVSSFFAFTLWVGLGIEAILSQIRNTLKEKKRTLITTSIASILALVFINGRMFQVNSWECSRANNYAPFNYAYNLLQSCDKNAILFTNGDNDTFPLWYLQEGAGIRQDVRIINLSLANTDWYVKQLIKYEPRGAKKVKMNLNVDQISRLGYQEWRDKAVSISIKDYPLLQKEKDMYLKGLRQSISTPQKLMPLAIGETMQWTFKPTVNYQGRTFIKMQDRVIYETLINNLQDRPIYFSVTVAQEFRTGIDPYLRLEGYAYRVVPLKSYGEIEPNIHYQKVMKEFKYKNFDNDKVYYDEVARRMIGQYKTIFITAAQPLAQHPDDTTMIQNEKGVLEPRLNRDIALEMTDFAIKKIPTDIWETPFFITTNAIELYASLGEKEKSKSLLPEAERLVLEYIADKPSDLTGKYYLSKAYRTLEMHDKALALLKDVAKSYPNDPSIAKQVSDMEKLISNNKKEASDSNALPTLQKTIK